MGEISKLHNGEIVLLNRVNMSWGYVLPDGKAYVYTGDHQGNIRVVTGPEREVVQTTDYYPYGMPMATSTGAAENPYKYSGKELETRQGLNLYDFHARLYPFALPLFNRPDPKASDYPWLSPYLYCAANPVRNIDPTGEDVFILYDEDTISHMAMLIQDDDGQWKYYSINGDKMYKLLVHNAGRPFNDVEVGSWDSPEDFLNSLFNNEEGTREDNTNNYFHYEEGFEIKTTSEQDAIMRDAFKEAAKSDYNLFNNNCATTVQRVMLKAGIAVSNKMEINYLPMQTDFGLTQVAIGLVNTEPAKITTFPGQAFKSIMDTHRNGRYIHK